MIRATGKDTPYTAEAIIDMNKKNNSIDVLYRNYKWYSMDQFTNPRGNRSFLPNFEYSLLLAWLSIVSQLKLSLYQEEKKLR